MISLDALQTAAPRAAIPSANREPRGGPVGPRFVVGIFVVAMAFDVIGRAGSALISREIRRIFGRGSSALTRKA